MKALEYTYETLENFPFSQRSCFVYVHVSPCAIPPKIQSTYAVRSISDALTCTHTYTHNKAEPLYTYLRYILSTSARPSNSVWLCELCTYFMSKRKCACVQFGCCWWCCWCCCCCCRHCKTSKQIRTCGTHDRVASSRERLLNGEHAAFKDTFLRAFAAFRSVPRPCPRVRASARVSLLMHTRACMRTHPQRVGLTKRLPLRHFPIALACAHGWSHHATPCFGVEMKLPYAINYIGRFYIIVVVAVHRRVTHVLSACVRVG